VANSRGNDIVAFSQTEGRFLGVLVGADQGLEEPDSMAIGPDGALYVTSGAGLAGAAVLRYDVDTGAFLGPFAAGHGLNRPYGLAFGPDGYLYVASFLGDQILRFDAHSGAFVDVFATGDAAPGGLNGPDYLAFGPEGGLYVTTQGSVAGEFPGLPSEVLRYDIRTGSHRVFIQQPAPAASSQGFVSELGIQFGPDCGTRSHGTGGAGRWKSCDLWVSDFAQDVRRYDAHTGALLEELDTNYTGTLPSNDYVGEIAFGQDGRLFVVGFDNLDPTNPGVLLRFDGRSGRPLPAPGEAGALLVAPTPTLARPIGILAVGGEDHSASCGED
jgi:DNA-binding beta-propeller fold protein YncE